jgi:hypothetical protein
MGYQKKSGLATDPSRGPALLNEPDVSDLQHICDVLNGKKLKRVSSELRRLVARWKESGPNLKKMMHADFALWGQVQGAWEAKWTPTNTGRAHLLLFPGLPKEKMRKARDGRHQPTPEGGALILFYALTLNRDLGKLGGPCAWCENYYVMNTARQTKYCTRRCSSLATATVSTSQRLANQYADKLLRASTAADQWAKTRTSLSWKQWVSVREPDISPKWLTRAVNNGDLKSPIK